MLDKADDDTGIASGPYLGEVGVQVVAVTVAGMPTTIVGADDEVSYDCAGAAACTLTWNCACFCCFFFLAYSTPATAQMSSPPPAPATTPAMRGVSSFGLSVRGLVTAGAALGVVCCVGVVELGVVWLGAPPPAGVDMIGDGGGGGLGGGDGGGGGLGGGLRVTQVPGLEPPQPTSNWVAPHDVHGEHVPLETPEQPDRYVLVGHELVHAA